MASGVLRNSSPISASVFLVQSSHRRLGSSKHYPETISRICLSRRTITWKFPAEKPSIRCSGSPSQTLRTCKNCKTQFDPLLNHPRACRFHTAHFGGETKRKFESVYTGGTMDTADSGQVFQYWHCCGSEDPFDPGCTAAPHFSYDD